MDMYDAAGRRGASPPSAPFPHLSICHNVKFDITVQKVLLFPRHSSIIILAFGDEVAKDDALM